MDELYELKDELAESNKILRELDQKIERLKSQGKFGANIRHYYLTNQKLFRNTNFIKRK